MDEHEAITPYGAEATVLLPEPLDDLTENDKICSDERSRCNDRSCNPEIPYWDTKKNIKEGRWAYCIRKGSRATGCILDQRRPLQPMISAIPASTVVPSSHHNRECIACVKWIAGEVIEQRKWR